MKFRLETVDDKHVAGIHEVDRADLDTVAEHCAQARSAGATGSKDMKHVARVPEWKVMEYLNRRGMTFAQLMRDQFAVEKMLADPEFAAFRVWTGKI